MSFLMRQVAHCDVCGHEWLTSKVPSHCAKCKSRKWNSQPEPVVVIHDGGASLYVQTPSHVMAKINGLERHHDPKTCRVYKCGMCASLKP